MTSLSSSVSTLIAEDHLTTQSTRTTLAIQHSESLECKILSNVPPLELDPMPPSEVRFFNAQPALELTEIIKNIPKFTFKLDIHAEETPSRWLLKTHPDGSRYFDLHVGDMMVLTTNDIVNTDIATVLEGCAVAVYAAAKSILTAGDPIELVLEIIHDSWDPRTDWCGYYIVNHESQSIFWAHDFNTAYWGKFKIASKSHPASLMYALENEYWEHCVRFPNDRALPQHVFEKLRDHIAVSSARGFELYAISEYLKDRVGIVNAHSVLVAAHLMQRFIAGIISGKG
ncbi:hypothetical protein M405DRAFT_938013 [Rhizopogon salebrosus TDB-379]|nr:hypothetical protein M405DRAFT_938013 [Rhizopogon salebrosus TDB-379]